MGGGKAASILIKSLGNYLLMEKKRGKKKARDVLEKEAIC